ncbi:DUF6069 family protein [Haladaptatus sp. CMAA 1909]
MAQLVSTGNINSRTQPDIHRFAKYGLLAVLISIIVNAIIRVIAYQFIAIPADFWPLGWGAVITSTAVTTIGATVVYWASTRFSQRPNRTFVIISVLVLLLSFVSFIMPPPVLEEAATSVHLVLAGMHMSVAVICVSVLTRITDTTVVPDIHDTDTSSE